MRARCVTDNDVATDDGIVSANASATIGAKQLRGVQGQAKDREALVIEQRQAVADDVAGVIALGVHGVF